MILNGLLVNEQRSYPFLVRYNFLLLMVVQQLAAILECLQERMSTCPSTLPSCSAVLIINDGTIHFIYVCVYIIS